jgi:glucose/arabinose dehydrogenase
MTKTASGGLFLRGSLAAALAIAPLSQGWAQPPAAPAKVVIPQFPPAADYPGVAGSPAELARIKSLCGTNRNARDGYAPTPAFAGQTRAPIIAGTQGYAVESVAKIDRPFGMAFLPDGKMLVTFRAGGMRVVGQDGVVSDLLENVPQVFQPRIGSGLYDVILDRNFARNRTIYFTYYTKAEGDVAAQGRISSARLSADEKRLEDVKVLRAGPDIEPRRIVQARDGTLLILSAGDIADVGPDPQDLASQAGKVLRINTDGTIPKDNPFLSDPKANPAVWALGFRDIHAATLNPKTGELWVAENEPMGGDELNVMRAGKNYGFPVISYGRQNSGAMINGGKTAEAGMEQPLYFWTPSFAPSGMTFYSGNALKGWKGNIFIGGMSGQQLVRLVMNSERVVGEEKLLMDRCQRFKVVQQGPDGNLYLLTDETPPHQNEVLRLVPAATVPARRVSPPPATTQP